jgi:proline iminopeptidase
MFVTMTDGTRLLVELIGGEDPKKPLLIVHHGAPGASNHGESKSSFEFLSDRFRVLVFDARGSGESDVQPPFTNAQWVADVDELRRWAHAEKIVIAGGSYGGFIALEYALAHPDRVSAIVLRDTAARGGPILTNSLERGLNSDRVKIDRARLKRMFSGTLHDDADMEASLNEILPLYAGIVEPCTASEPEPPVAPRNWQFRAVTHNAAFSQNLPGFDLRERLGEIGVPTLVTVGRHDWITPVSCSEEIVMRISEAELAVFEQSGHSPPADEPTAFRATVRSFLEKWIPEYAI